MQFKGSDFIQNVQRQKEVEELRQRLDELESEQDIAKNQAYYDKDEYSDEPSNYPQNDMLQDIALKTEQKKPPIDFKKLIFLGLFLGIVFIFTIIVIRFFMNYATQNDLLDTPPKVDEVAIEQKFEQIVTQTKDMNISKEANTSSVDSNVSIPNVTTQSTIQQNIPPVQTTHVTLPTQKTPTQDSVTKEVQPKKESTQTKIEQVIEKKQNDANTQKRDIEQLFGLKEENQKHEAALPSAKQTQIVTTKKIEQKVVEKPKNKVVQSSTPAPKLETAKQKNIVAKSTHKDLTPSNEAMVYIQTGIFTQVEPKPEYLAKIKDAGYSYKFIETSMDNKSLKKIVVGPFAESKARDELAKVRQSITSDAFILKNTK